MNSKKISWENLPAEFGRETSSKVSVSFDFFPENIIFLELVFDLLNYKNMSIPLVLIFFLIWTGGSVGWATAKIKPQIPKSE